MPQKVREICAFVKGRGRRHLTLSVPRKHSDTLTFLRRASSTRSSFPSPLITGKVLPPEQVQWEPECRGSTCRAAAARAGPRGRTRTNLVQNLYKTCINPAQTLHKTCTKPVQILYKHCTKPVQTLYKSCTKSVQTLYKPCTKPVQSLYKICTKPPQTLLLKPCCSNPALFLKLGHNNGPALLARSSQLIRAASFHLHFLPPLLQQPPGCPQEEEEEEFQAGPSCHSATEIKS